MPLIRKQLKPSDVYPENIRYDQDTDTVQSNINGDWVDNPEADPRHQTTYPPRMTSDTKCDAAQSVTDAFKNQIDGILTAIDNGATAFTIAGFILSIFSFGVFAVFIGLALYIADQMLSAGTTALEAALTDPVWEDFKCILYCNMTPDGRLNYTSIETVKNEVNIKIGGLAATILNGMLQLSGEGGVNNLAALGEAEGICIDCECDNYPEIEWWTQGSEVTPGVVTLVAPGTYRITSGTSNFGGIYNTCSWRNVAPYTECFRVVRMVWITGSECLPPGRRYRALCGGGDGFGDFVANNELVVGASVDDYGCWTGAFEIEIDVRY